MQTVRVNLRSAGAMGVQTCAHHAQEDMQCRVECTLVALQVIAQAFGDRQHHWRTGRRGNTGSLRGAAASAMRRVLHEGQTPRSLQEKATR